MKGGMNMRAHLQKFIENRVQQYVNEHRTSCQKIESKKDMFAKRSAQVVKAKAVGNINKTTTPHKDVTEVYYTVHYQYLVEQKGFLYLEEELEDRKAEFSKGKLIEDNEVSTIFYPLESPSGFDEELGEREQQFNRTAFTYNRLKAVQYAEQWWNSYNPYYKKFENDCTNFISQCLHQGGAPMRGYPNRSKGWWMTGNNWSYSWTIANSLRLYLTNSTVGLRAKQVSSPEQLLFGDVICYDFEGDGRYNHNTIVTAKDALGMPLVNAHTTNSRMRYWSYEDSTAYTPNIQYKFFTIIDDYPG
jgi:hypothetical protein